MGQYDRQIATAKRLLTKYGEPCVWAFGLPGVVDPTMPWLQPTAGATQMQTAPIAFFALNRQWSELIRLLKGTEVVTGSNMGYMPAADWMAALPKPTQLTGIVTRKDGTKLIPITVEPLQVNDQIIMYTIEFRK